MKRGSCFRRHKSLGIFIYTPHWPLWFARREVLFLHLLHEEKRERETRWRSHRSLRRGDCSFLSARNPSGICACFSPWACFLWRESLTGQQLGQIRARSPERLLQSSDQDRKVFFSPRNKLFSRVHLSVQIISKVSIKWGWWEDLHDELGPTVPCNPNHRYLADPSICQERQQHNRYNKGSVGPIIC